MYETYFGLSERPFSIAPDPQYLYMSTRHKEAMAHLSYGLSQGGCFIVLTGEVGTGKTTLCRNLLSDLPDNVDVALVLNANINEDELLQTICDELKIAYQGADSQKQLLDIINAHLMDTFANNRHTVLIIDEAQLLSRDVLEKIRLLTNLETTKTKLLQIILIGQPELNEILARNDLRQLAQRVTARYHLGALKRNEIEEYVNYRLGVAGCKQPLFSRQALNSLHSVTSGIPRKINVLADHALLATYSKNQNLVDAKTIKHAANDVFIKPAPSESSSLVLKPWWLIVSFIVMLNLALWWWFVANNNTGKVSTHISQTGSVSAPASPAAISQPAISDAPVTQTSDTETAAAPNLNEALKSLADIANEPNPSITSATSIDADQTVNIVARADIQPGSVIVSEEFLDAEPINAIRPSPSAALTEPLSRVDADFEAALEASADLTGRIFTFKSLAKLWQVELDGALLKPICTELLQTGLSCLPVNDWQQLLRMNRPAVMLLKHDQQLHRVILQSTQGETAFVRIGDSVRELAVPVLRDKWLEQAVILWRPPQFGAPFVQQGQQSSEIPAVRTYLNQALIQANLPSLANVTSNEFDLEMSQKAFALQTRFGVTPDSKIGNETYMLMNEIIKPQSTLVLKNRFN